MKKLAPSLLAFALVFLTACNPVDPGPVATVNGVEITRAEFNREVEFELASFVDGEYELTDEDIEVVQEAVLERLINNHLLLEAAAAVGITHETVDFEGTFAEIIGNYDTETEFEAELLENGFTVEEFRGLIADALVIEELFEVELHLSSLEVSDDELEAVVAEYLAILGEEAQDIDPEDIRLYVEQSLKDEMAYELRMTFIQDLWEQGEIEFLER